MTNAWKADLGVARLALSADVARAACLLTGWSGVRLGQDSIWWKAPKTKPISLHQDSSFMDFLDPPSTITCWITLDDTAPEAGTIEYVPGSHRWPLTTLPSAFHGDEDYRAPMHTAADAVGIVPPAPQYVIAPAGSCVFHAGEIWHGSGPNITNDRMRRSIGIHLLPEEAHFSGRPGGYIYRRYQRTGETILDESFFFRLCGHKLEAARVGSRTIARPGYAFNQVGCHGRAAPKPKLHPPLLRIAEPRDFELAAISWDPDFADPWSYLADYRSDSGAANFGAYADPLFDHLLDQSNQAGQDSVQRMRLLEAAERRIIDNEAVIPLRFGVVDFIVNVHLKGWVASPLARHPARYLRIEGAPRPSRRSSSAASCAVQLTDGMIARQSRLWWAQED